MEYELKRDNAVKYCIAPYDDMDEKMEETPSVHHEHRDILQ